MAEGSVAVAVPAGTYRNPCNLRHHARVPARCGVTARPSVGQSTNSRLQPPWRHCASTLVSSVQRRRREDELENRRAQRSSRSAPSRARCEDRSTQGRYACRGARAIHTTPARAGRSGAASERRLGSDDGRSAREDLGVGRPPPRLNDISRGVRVRVPPARAGRHLTPAPKARVPPVTSPRLTGGFFCRRDHL
jgi:hypothetical protein